jgi:hypothetical protein
LAVEFIGLDVCMHVTWNDHLILLELGNDVSNGDFPYNAMGERLIYPTITHFQE